MKVDEFCIQEMVAKPGVFLPSCGKGVDPFYIIQHVAAELYNLSIVSSSAGKKPEFLCIFSMIRSSHQNLPVSDVMYFSIFPGLLSGAYMSTYLRTVLSSTEPKRQIMQGGPKTAILIPGCRQPGRCSQPGLALVLQKQFPVGAPESLERFPADSVHPVTIIRSGVFKARYPGRVSAETGVVAVVTASNRGISCRATSAGRVSRLPGPCHCCDVHVPRSILRAAGDSCCTGTGLS